MSYKIVLLRGARRFMKTVQVKYAKNIEKNLIDLAKDPYAATNVKRLKGAEYFGYAVFRLRVNDYRIVYYIENNEICVYVIDIDHRNKIYKK